MVVVAQLVRALDCGSRGRRFEPGLPPQKRLSIMAAFFCIQNSDCKSIIDYFTIFLRKVIISSVSIIISGLTISITDFGIIDTSASDGS